MNNIPNIISASRGVSALAMLLFPAFSIPFLILYCWCGFSDMIDGALARKMNAESKVGARIDSMADLFFVICSAVMILPTVHLPLWVWIWTAAIGTIKSASIIIGSCRKRKLSVPHSISNRLTGVLLFFLPFAIFRSVVYIPVVIVCLVATASLFEDVQIIRK